jgi:monoamine oxidase
MTQRLHHRTSAACGIRDWGKDPYGAAVHVWKPRAKSWKVAETFTAFSLDGHNHNVHICGDAYSDYQGFIEGALRSAGRVLSYLRSGSKDEQLPPLTADVPRSTGRRQ